MLRDKITIIIPEHKRPDHLKRLLAYFLDFGLKIIVADSSDIEFKYFAEFKQRIIYRHYPGEDLAAKLNKVINLIDTPYVVMCANDDFLVPKALEELVDFLEINHDYNSAQGLYTDFKVKDRTIINSLRYVDTIDVNLNSELSSERLLQLQENYFQYYYAVFRSSTFLKVISSLIINNQSQIKNLCLLESYISCFVAIDGKHLIKPIFYAARENMPISAATQTDTIPVVIKRKKYKKEYQQYLTLLSSHLTSVQGLTQPQAAQCVNNAVKIYILQIYPDYYTIKGKTKFIIKDFLTKLGIAGYLRGLFHKPNEIVSLPESISKSKEMHQIEAYIRKYDYIYKES